MKRLPSDIQVKNSLKAACYRQTATDSVVGYHELPPERFDIVVERESSRELGVSHTDSSQQHLDFSFPTVDRSSLRMLVQEKRLDEFGILGGVRGIATSLQTDANRGIKGDNNEIMCRTSAFGANTYPVPPTKKFSHFIWKALKNPAIVILLICSALLLGFGIKVGGLEEGWHDGGGIVIASLLVVFVTAISNFRQNRQLDNVIKISNDIQVEVVRDGRRQQISIVGAVVGDVVFVKIGDQVPADGLFIEGRSLLVDESSLTGGNEPVEINSTQNPFLLSGTKVADGYGKMLITCVGMNTSWGVKMTSAISSRECDEKTPLQARLDKLTTSLGMVSLAVTFVVLVMILVRYFMGNTKDENGNREFNGCETKVFDMIKAMVGIIAAVVATVAVAIPLGLPCVVSLFVSHSMKGTMEGIAMVRKRSACETMGMVTTICTDIPPSSNQLKVTKFFIGTESMEGRSYTCIAPKVLEQLFKGIILARESVHKLFAGTQIDDAIHLWAVIRQNIVFERVADSSILGIEASCPERKRIGVMVKDKTEEAVLHAYWRGDAERIITSSSHCLDTSGNITLVDEQKRERIQQILEEMAASGLVRIGFAHKQVSRDEYDLNEEKIPDTGLILLGYVGLKVTHHPSIREAVQFCHVAGVGVRMITSENALAAKATAIQCGILNSTSIEGVVEGAVFGSYPEDEQSDRVEKISVLARSSVLHKLQMVQSLRRNGHVVGVTGDGTNDVPALMEADIGLAMGTTQVAKESSDIVILDDNFASVVPVLRCGRCVLINIQKFIQFQLTLNIAALAINSVAAIVTGKTQMPAFQLLWVNLIMDSLAALALANEPPTFNLEPVSRADPIISNFMWRNILGQVSYQIGFILFVMFESESMFGDHTDTIIFNTFVLLQVFNLVNARRLQEKNVFEGIIKNKTFLGIIGIIIVLQVVMVQFMNKLGHTKRLNWKEWGISVGIAVLSWPVALLVKFVPLPTRPIFSYVIWKK